MESKLSPKTQIPWRNTYLFACCVVYNNHSGSTTLQDSKNQHEKAKLNIEYYNVLGCWFRSSLRPNLINETTEQTQQRIISFFSESIAVHDFRVIYVFAKLKLTFAHELLLDDGSDIFSVNNKLNELVGDLLPQFAGERIDTFKGRKAVRHVLYFEPSTHLIAESDRENNEKTFPLLERLQAQFGRPKRIQLPTILEDMFLFPGIGYGGSERSCLAVRLYPFERVQPEEGLSDLLQIPLVPISFLNHVAICTIQDYCSSMLSSLMLSTDQYWELGKSWSNFINYRDQYLKTRLEVEHLVMKVHELNTSIDDLLPTTHIYGKSYIDFFDKISFKELSSEILKQSFSAILKKKKQIAGVRLQHNVATVKNRMSSLDSFLHDSGMADSISTNFRLAKSVERLTRVVIFIATLTFIATLVPDNIKTSALSWVLTGTNIELVLRDEQFNPSKQIGEYKNTPPVTAPDR